MKILFIAPANSIHTVRWVNSMAERGHEVHLITLCNHRNTEKNIDSSIKVYELSVSGTKGYYLNAFATRKIAERIKPDVINVHYASGYGTLMRMARLEHTMLSVWGSDVYDFPYQSKLKMHIIKKNLNYANVLAATSNCMADQTRKILQKNLKIAITPFGVELENFRIPKRDNDNLFEIGCIKTLEQTYGINYLIQAIGLLIQKLNENDYQAIAKRIRCKIYGAGSQKEGLQKLIGDLKLDNVVRLMGRIPHEQVPDALSRMDIFCCLSERESFGVAAVEASASGLPVVVSDADGFCEVVENGETGLIVKRKSAEEAANALLKLVLDKELRERMGTCGRQRVEKLYEWRKNVDTMERFYYEMLGRR